MRYLLFLLLSLSAIAQTPQLEATDWLGISNFGNTTFTTSIDKTNVFDAEIQIFEEIQLLSYTPTGSYTVATFAGVPLSMTFNQPITALTGNIVITNSENTTIATIPVSSITIDGNSFSFPLNSEDYPPDTYTVSVPSGAFQGSLGVSDAYSWQFTIGNGDYSPEDYSPTDYFTS